MNNTASVKQTCLDDIFFIPELGDLNRKRGMDQTGIKQTNPFRVTEDQQNYTVSLEAPGLDTSDFEVCITDGILVVKFRQRNPYNSDKQDNPVSFPSVKFFRLSDDIHKDHFQAVYDNEVLKIRLQKKNA